MRADIAVTIYLLETSYFPFKHVMKYTSASTKHKGLRHFSTKRKLKLQPTAYKMEPT